MSIQKDKVFSLKNTVATAFLVSSAILGFASSKSMKSDANELSNKSEASAKKTPNISMHSSDDGMKNHKKNSKKDKGQLESLLDGAVVKATDDKNKEGSLFNQIEASAKKSGLDVGKIEDNHKGEGTDLNKLANAQVGNDNDLRLAAGRGASVKSSDSNDHNDIPKIVDDGVYVPVDHDDNGSHDNKVPTLPTSPTKPDNGNTGGGTTPTNPDDDSNIPINPGESGNTDGGSTTPDKPDDGGTTPTNPDDGNTDNGNNDPEVPTKNEKTIVYIDSATDKTVATKKITINEGDNILQKIIDNAPKGYSGLPDQGDINTDDSTIFYKVQKVGIPDKPDDGSTTGLNPDGSLTTENQRKYQSTLSDADQMVKEVAGLIKQGTSGTDLSSTTDYASPDGKKVVHINTTIMNDLMLLKNAQNKTGQVQLDLMDKLATDVSTLNATMTEGEKYSVMTVVQDGKLIASYSIDGQSLVMTGTGISLPAVPDGEIVNQ